MKRRVVFLVTSALVHTATSGCSRAEYKPIATVPSPDRAFVARSELKEEGTLGSSRYRVSVSKADGTQAVVALKGVNGWFSAPVWQNSSTLLVPFCFGSISSLTSVLPLKGSEVIRYGTTSSAYIRVHVITAPMTDVAGVHFCTTAQ